MAEVILTTIDEDMIDTILAKDVSFSGSMQFKKPLMIKGHVSGDIRASGDLYIEADAVVEANIQAAVVSVKGRVKGNVVATGKVELFACCTLDGDIIAPEITMETGCHFNGICKMTGTKSNA